MIQEGSRLKRSYRVLANIVSLIVRFRMVWLLVEVLSGPSPATRWAPGSIGSRGPSIPHGTLVINVSGSFILGIAAVIILERMPPEYGNWYLLIGTGFCGGYTTFSTFEWETFKLVRDGNWWLALANVLSSVAAGFVGVLLAVMLVHLVFPKGIDP